MFAAAVGDLGLPVSGKPDDELGIESAELAPAELAAHVGPAEPADVHPPGTGPVPPEASSAEAPGTTIDRSEATAREEATEEQPDKTPAFDIATAPDQLAPETDPLADLDRMLANGAAASLGAATGARGTTTPKSTRVKLERPHNHEDPVPASGPKQQNTDTPMPSTDEIEAELLRQGRFGLAADLRQSRGGSEAEVSARLLAAYAADLRQATGPLATAFAREAPGLTRETLASHRPGQLVAWAGAVRIAVLSPSACAAGLITELSACVSGHPALVEIGQSFAEASRSGLLVLPEVANAVEALSIAETDAEELARLAAETLSLAPQRSIKYAPANRVYQIWMNSDGLLWRAAWDSGGGGTGCP